MIQVVGAHGVKATVLAHSVAYVNGVLRPIASLELEYPRVVLAELNTHGMICKNSHSSRAIPFDKMVNQLTGRPIRFGANKSGMQDKGEDHNAPVWEYRQETPEAAWGEARNFAIAFSRAFFEAGYHKQVYNRLTEPFQMMRTVVTATEFANFFWLRNHDAADPSLQELARCMYEALSQSKPQVLKAGEWHLPYVGTTRTKESATLLYFIEEETETGGKRTFLAPSEALAVSTARSAAVSFRNTDYGVEKSKEVFKRLLSDQRVHGSAFQHQATPMRSTMLGNEDDNEPSYNHPMFPDTWEEGVTHMDRDGAMWSAQFNSWIMHRKLIPGENKPGFMLEAE